MNMIISRVQGSCLYIMPTLDWLYTRRKVLKLQQFQSIHSRHYLNIRISILSQHTGCAHPSRSARINVIQSHVA